MPKAWAKLPSRRDWKSTSVSSTSQMSTVVLPCPISLLDPFVVSVAACDGWSWCVAASCMLEELRWSGPCVLKRWRLLGGSAAVPSFPSAPCVWLTGGVLGRPMASEERALGLVSLTWSSVGVCSAGCDCCKLAFLCCSSAASEGCAGFQLSRCVLQSLAGCPCCAERAVCHGGAVDPAGTCAMLSWSGGTCCAEADGCHGGAENAASAGACVMLR